MHVSALLPRAALVAASLLVPLASQSVSFAAGELTRIRLSAAAPSQGLTQAVTGHFTGMHVRDAIVLAGSTPILVSAPGVLRSAVRLPDRTHGATGFDRTDVRAIAAVPGLLRFGMDALAVVTGGGLWLWYKDPDPTSRTARYHVKLLSAQPVWAGVTRLRVADIDNQGKLGIVGLQQNATTIRCIEVGNLADATPWTQWTQWTLPTGGRVNDFQVADVIPGGLPELVVLNSQVTGAYPFAGGLRLFAPGSAVPLQSVLAPNGSGALATVTDGSGTRVFAAARFGSSDQLAVFVGGPTGLLAGGAGSVVALGGEPTALAVAPWRDPAQLDAVVTLKTQTDPVVVACQGSLLLSSPNVVPIANAAAPVDYQNQATPLIADFHGDPAAPPERRGRPRLLYPVENLGPGQPAAIAVQNEIGTVVEGQIEWPEGYVGFGETSEGTPRILGVPASGPQPTRIGMVSWSFDASPAAPADRKASVAVLEATTAELEHRTDPEAHRYASLWTQEGSSDVWQFMVRFESGAGDQTIRWPARAALAMRQDYMDILDRVREAMQQIYGPGILLPDNAVDIFFYGGRLWGITGDVIPPPGSGDTDDTGDEPPQGPGG